MTRSEERRFIRQVELARAIKAAQAAGLYIRAVEITANGDLRIVTSDAAGAGVQDELEAWRAMRDTRSERQLRYPSADRVDHHPIIDRELAEVAGRADWSRVRNASGARTMTATEVATALNVPVDLIDRAVATGQLERYRSSRLCFTETGLKRSLQGAMRRVAHLRTVRTNSN